MKDINDIACLTLKEILANLAMDQNQNNINQLIIWAGKADEQMEKTRKINARRAQIAKDNRNGRDGRPW